ncbi:hypothetical protein [Lentilactobacillus hilgardii]|uniref:hypothetical protein n=1 Tax=Lentilactobacillus hilgardii TaxID=1588 RepID=UPI00390C6921
MSTASDAVKNAYSSALATLNKTESAYEQANTDYLNMLDQALMGTTQVSMFQLIKPETKKLASILLKQRFPISVRNIFCRTMMVILEQKSVVMAYAL